MLARKKDQQKKRSLMKGAYNFFTTVNLHDRTYMFNSSLFQSLDDILLKFITKQCYVLKIGFVFFPKLHLA